MPLGFNNITGYVTDINNNPVQGAKITLYRDINYSLYAYSNTAGYYEILNAAYGNIYDIKCEKVGYATQSINHFILDSDKIFNFTRFDNRISVNINALDNRTNTALICTITLVGPATYTQNNTFNQTIIPGNYTLTITSTGYLTKTEIINIFDIYSQNFYLQLNKAVITGYITNDAGSYIGNATVSIAGGGNTYTCLTNSAGYFEIIAPPDVAYTLTLSHPSYANKVIVLGTLAAGNYERNYSIGSLGIGYIVGTVLDNYNSPVKDAIITLSALNINSKVGLTDLSGFYNFSIAEGTYTVGVDKSYYTATHFDNVPIPSGITASQSFTNFSQYVGNIKGLIQNDIGYNLNNVNLSISNYYTTNSINGSYLFANIPIFTGSYIIASYSAHYAATTAVLTLPAATTLQVPTIVLQRFLGAVVGEVVDKDTDLPIRSAQLYTSFVPDSIFYNSISNKDYTFASPTGLPIGTHRLYVNPNDTGLHVATYQDFYVPVIQTIATVNFYLTVQNSSKLSGYIYTPLAGNNVPVDSMLLEIQKYVSPQAGIDKSRNWLDIYTDTNGYYEINNLSELNYFVTVAPNNFNNYIEQSAIVNVPLNAQINKNFILNNLNYGYFNITVINTYNKKLAAKITIKGNDFFTDSNGFCQISSVPFGSYTITTRHNPFTGIPLYYDDIRIETINASGAKNITIILTPIIDIEYNYRKWILTNKIDLT